MAEQAELAVCAEYDQRVCEYLEWDSSFFRRRVARLTMDRLDKQSAEAALKWCRLNRIDCLYFLATSSDPVTVRLAEDHGFRFVDIRMTFERPLGPGCEVRAVTSNRIRPCAVDDIPALQRIARAVHHDSRFYRDPLFPDSDADALYATWIERSCLGYADHVLVAEIQGELAGYISCHVREGLTGQIGLVGVGKDWLRIGLGQELVEAALNWLLKQGIERVKVVTQGSNGPAQRLYQRSGFLTRSIDLWYHKWFISRAEGGL